MRTGGMRVGNRCYKRGHRSRRARALRASCVAIIQGPACTEKRAIAIQKWCRWLRGVESLELQEVALTTGPARLCAKLPSQGRGGEHGASTRAGSMYV